MGVKVFTLRWSWLIAISLLWIVVVYPACVLGMGRNLDHAAETSRSQCALLERYNGYAYAQCMQAATDVAADRKSEVSETAVLVSIGPVLLLWLAILLSRFVRVCRMTDENWATPGSFYRNAQRRRWKAR